MRSENRGIRFGSKGGKNFGPKWVNPGLFQRILLYILARKFFRSDFSTFWLSEPKCTEIWSEKHQNVVKYHLKKSRICPIWGQSEAHWSQAWNPWMRSEKSSGISFKDDVCCWVDTQSWWFSLQNTQEPLCLTFELQDMMMWRLVDSCDGCWPQV